MTAPDLYETSFRLAYLQIREQMEDIDFELVFDTAHYLEDHHTLWFGDELQEEKAAYLIERFQASDEFIEAIAPSRSTPNEILLQILRDLRH